MSILDESSEPAAKKKKVINLRRTLCGGKTGKTQSKMQRTHDILWGKRGKNEKLEIDIDELFENAKHDLKPVCVQ